MARLDTIECRDALAAIKTGRHFIGCEMSREYCALANERLRDLAGGGAS